MTVSVKLKDDTKERRFNDVKDVQRDNKFLTITGTYDGKKVGIWIDIDNVAEVYFEGL